MNKEYCTYTHAWEDYDGINQVISRPSCKGSHFFSFESAGDFNYCPWCGKEIKTVTKERGPQEEK